MNTRTQSQPLQALISLSVLCFGVMLAVLAPLSVSAQDSAGVSISPAIIEETLDPGVEKEYTVSIENLNQTTETFYLFARDIEGVTGNGTPIFARDGAERTEYELSTWVELTASELTLEPGEEQQVSFIMRVPNNASPGSHFGGVFISVDPPEIAYSGAAVGYQVANIISIRVSGDAVESASIRQFATDKFLYSKQEVDFSVRIENEGNVLVRPTGPLEVYNMLGEKVDTIVFNTNQAAVFPGVSRDYAFGWEGEGVGFGRYEAVLSAVYGDTGAKKTISSTVTFWVLPMNIIGPAAGVLALLLLVTYIGVRIYIKRTLAHLSYGGNTRIVRRRRKNKPTLLLLLVVMLTVTALFLIILLALFA